MSRKRIDGQYRVYQEPDGSRLVLTPKGRVLRLTDTALTWHDLAHRVPLAVGALWAAVQLLPPSL